MNTRALEDKLNGMILSGKIMEAFEELYADDVVMVENFDEPCVGKDANRKRELAFLDAVAEFHGATLGKSAAEGDTSFSEWVFDATYKGGGRNVLKQVAVRTWRDGKVVHERFYYKPGA